MPTWFGADHSALASRARKIGARWGSSLVCCIEVQADSSQPSPVPRERNRRSRRLPRELLGTGQRERFALEILFEKIPVGNVFDLRLAFDPRASLFS